jgi:hypothetical protein
MLPAAAAALGAAAVFALLSGSGKSAPQLQPALAELERMLDHAGYGLTQIVLTGHRLTPDSDVFDAINLGSTPTLLSFDSRAAQARVERLSWVERASIERVFPDRLESTSPSAFRLQLAPRLTPTVDRPDACSPPWRRTRAVLPRCR